MGHPWPRNSRSTSSLKSTLSSLQSSTHSSTLAKKRRRARARATIITRVKMLNDRPLKAPTSPSWRKVRQTTIVACHQARKMTLSRELAQVSSLATPEATHTLRQIQTSPRMGRLSKDAGTSKNITTSWKRWSSSAETGSAWLALSRLEPLHSAEATHRSS